MSVGGRGETRQRMLRRAWIVAVILVVLAFLLLVSGHWLLGIVFAVAAAAAVWLVLQLRGVR